MVMWLNDREMDSMMAGLPKEKETERGDLVRVGKGKQIVIEADTWLKCPVCGDIYLHHGAIRVYDRDREVGDGKIVNVEAGKVIVEPAKSDSIPGQRDSIAIDFWCEHGCRVTLRIAQHKGNTIMEWINEEEAEIKNLAEWPEWIK